MLMGCGGGETADSTTTTTSTTSPAVIKANYVAEANSICKVMNDAVAALPDPGSDPIKYADVVDEAIRIISNTLAKLRVLPPPAEDEAALEAIWSKVDVVIDDYSKLSSALRNGDLDSAPQLSQTAEASQKAANDASIEYGLTVCGS